jgi:filamentous hemagglutinin
MKKNSMLLSDSETNVNNETQSLLDNAADEYARLGLDLNESPTQAQIDNLQKDIIWYETETINGNMYIVPKIYLTKATRDKLKNNDSLATKSTILALGDLQLNSDSLSNSGSIIAGNNSTITTNNDITNKNHSEITATNNLSLTSNNGSIINFSKLGAKGILSLTAANNITNSATIQTNASNLLDTDNPSYISNGIGATNSGNISSTLFETAMIEAGTISINAGNDFNNYGSNITSSGDMNITAGDDINIETVELRNRSEYRSKKYTKITDTTTNTSSNITSAGGITLTTNGTGTDNEAGTSDLGVGSSILVSGSNVSAVNDLNLNANNNAIITNAVNKDYSFEQRTKKGSIKTSRTSSTDYVETAVNSNLSGKNVNITTNNNIYVQGSDLNSNFDTATNTGGNTNLSATNDTIITNAILQEYHHATKEVSNRGAFKGVTAITSAVIDLATVGINAAIAVRVS